MSVKDVIKNSFLKQMGTYDMGSLAISLLAAVLLGVFIYLVYKTFYSGVIYSRSFAVTLVGMCVLTCMVTLAISTNVVISLGMVGALSIVRFRTAIKDPMDLLYLFWAITVGITTGATMYGLALISSIVMVVMIVAFYYHQEKGQIYIAVIHYAAPALEEDVFRAFQGQKFRLKSQTMRKDQTELAAEVFVRNGDTSFAERMRDIDGVRDVTLIQYNGEYHG